MNQAILALQAAMPELDPSLDPSMFGAEFRRASRVHFPDVLTPGAAERLHRALVEESSWSLAYTKQGEHFEADNVRRKQRNELTLEAWQRARDGYQYFYDRYLIARAGGPCDTTHYFAKLAAFLNGEAFLGLARALTGFSAIQCADAQARFCRPGDFCTVSDGQDHDSAKLAYYVLSLTPGWRAEWGGIVQFHDPSGDIVGGFVPAFNSLMVFSLPQLHSMSQIVTFGGYRYSVEGWLYGIVS